MNLSDRALLVQLTISQWTARKYDKKATQEVATTFNTSKDAGRYNKSLLPMNDYLDRVHKKTTHIREKFYKNTLPWGMEGTMMLNDIRLVELALYCFLFVLGVYTIGVIIKEKGYKEGWADGYRRGKAVASERHFD